MKMTKAEFRKTKEYADAVNKIRNQRVGFKFTIPYHKMSKGLKNAMDVVTSDCVREGIIESISIGVNLAGEWTEETFKRI